MRTLTTLCIILFASLSAQAERFGDWIYTESKDAITDADRSSVHAFSHDGEQLVAFKLLDDGLNFAYFFNTYLAGDRDIQVLVVYRVDTRPAAEELYWDLSGSQKAAFIPMARVQAIIKELKTGKQLVMRVTDPADGEVITRTFNIQGLEQALARLLR